MPLTDEAIVRIRALVQPGKPRPGPKLPPERPLAEERAAVPAIGA